MKRSVRVYAMVMAVLAVLMLASPGYSWTRSGNFHHHRHFGPFVSGFYGYYPYAPYSYYGPYGPYYSSYYPYPSVRFRFRF